MGPAPRRRCQSAETLEGQRPGQKVIGCLVFICLESVVSSRDCSRTTVPVVPGSIPWEADWWGVKVAVHWVRAKIAPNRLIAEFNISGYGDAR